MNRGNRVGPIEDLRHYLRKQFGNVKDEPCPLPDYYAFSVELPGGERRTLTVHRDLFVFDLVRTCMNEELVEKLRRDSVEMTKPIRGQLWPSAICFCACATACWPTVPAGTRSCFQRTSGPTAAAEPASPPAGSTDPAPSGCPACAPLRPALVFPPPHRPRLVSPVQQLFPNGWPMLFQITV